VYDKKPEVPDLITSGLNTVAVRMPSHPIALELLKRAGVPVAAPSANKFGCLSPTQASHVVKQQMDPDYILDGGSTDFGIESTVVSVSEDGVKILRYGAISEEALAKHVKLITDQKADGDHLPHAPGMLKSHYSPRKPFYILNDLRNLNLPEASGLIVNSELQATVYSTIKIMPLSKDGDLNEMAVNLFAVLHQMEDDQQVKQIYFEAVPEIGIGKAIMDRARKAAYSYLNTTEASDQ
jgi:L-threonylcarbamoyladenylate synthase